MSLLDDEKKAEVRAAAVANESIKLTATYLNGLAIALVAVGFFAPSFSKPATPPSADELALQAATGLLCLTISGILHLSARLLLRSMR